MLDYISYVIPVITNFVLKISNFRYHGDKGRSGANFNDTVKLHDLKNLTSDARYLTVSHISRVTVNFVLKFLIFDYHGNKTWNALPEDVTSSQSEYTFHHQLKTWLLRSLFWTSSSDTACILTFSLGLSVPTLRRFCHLRTTIWYDMMIRVDVDVG